MTMWMLLRLRMILRGCLGGEGVPEFPQDVIEEEDDEDLDAKSAKAKL